VCNGKENHSIEVSASSISVNKIKNQASKCILLALWELDFFDCYVKLDVFLQIKTCMYAYKKMRWGNLLSELAKINEKKSLSN